MSRIGPASASGPMPDHGPIYDVVLRGEADLALLRTRIDVPADYRPLGREPYRIEVRGVGVGLTRFWETSSDTGFRCLSPAGGRALVLRVPVAGAIRREAGGERVEAAAGTGLLTMPGAAHAVEALPGFQAFNCMLDEHAVQRAVADMEGRDEIGPLRFAPRADMGTPALRSLGANLAAVTRSLPLLALSEPDIGLPLLTELFLHQLATAWPTLGGGEVRPAALAPPSRFHRALDYIEAHLAQALTVSEVARAADLGVRALQNAFRRELGSSPLAYIIERRLERARRDLDLGAGVSVSQIAYRWGFTHMGDFARRYHLRYGETPAQTLRRR